LRKGTEAYLRHGGDGLGVTELNEGGLFSCLPIDGNGIYFLVQNSRGKA